jgi:hypothetical protein
MRDNLLTPRHCRLVSRPVTLFQEPFETCEQLVHYVKCEAFRAMTLKNAVFWDPVRTLQERKHITYPLQSPVG